VEEVCGTMRTGWDFTRSVAEKLQEAGFQFEAKVAIGGVRLDFVVQAPDGREIVVEAKAWEQSRGFRNRAIHQARSFKEILGADEAFVVVQGLERSRVSEGVVTLDRLVSALQEELDKREGPKKARAAIRAPEDTVFAAMPFDEAYNDTYFLAMSYAAESVGAVCERVDQKRYSGDIVEMIKSMIRECKAMIADLSEANPNVLYEVGYAHGLGKPTVHICATPLSELPFNVSQWNTLKYTFGNTWEFREDLASALKSALAN
jgi:hypothetical protein